MSPMWMPRVALGVVVALLGLGVWLAGRTEAADKDAVGATTERLLREAKLDYRKVKDGVYRVVIEGGGEITAVVVEEKKAVWKDDKGGDVLFAFIWCEVVQLPTDFTPPLGMLKRLAELNDVARFGSIGMSKNPGGTTSIFRNSSCFLRGCDAEQLRDLCYVSHFERISVRKQLKGFIEK